jgi:peptidoglycan/LPS O-acetylase OafA/YrhL
MAPTPTATNTRMASLDVLRALAVALVIGRHMAFPLSGFGRVGGWLMATWVRGGWVGVDLFFVLSGFLVSGLLFREYQQKRKVAVGRFLIRRGLKIYPAFYLLLAVTVLETLVRKGAGAVSGRAVLAECLFVQNYGPSVLQHSWSLAVEEHFYLLAALLVFLLTRRARDGKDAADPYRAIPKVFSVVALLCLGARLVTGLVLPYSHHTHLFPTHLRLDGLMFGVCLSYLYHFHRQVLEATVGARPKLAMLVGAALMLPAFAFQLETTFFVYTVGLTGFYLGGGLLVLASTLRGPPDNRAVRLVAYVGSYSYSIYLWHVIVLSSSEHALGALHVDAHTPGAVAGMFTGCLAVGTVMAKLVEVPVLRIRDRLFPAKSA